jgi:large conductance mechanosensitive channel
MAKEPEPKRVGIFGGLPDFSSYVLTVGNSTFLIGEFINAVISFLIMATVVYFMVVLPVNTLMDRYSPQPEPKPTRECPECLSKIPKAARRCPDCTSQVEPVPDEEELANAR